MATLTGTADNDRIDGTATVDIISGLAGADDLSGFESNDAISGGRGADLLAGAGGDDLLFTDGSETLNGGSGIDVVILTDSDDVDEDFSFRPDNFGFIEGIQDVPDANTTVTIDANVLGTIEGNTFLFAMGEGTDELRVINDGTRSLEVTEFGDVLIGGTARIGLEGVESLVILDAGGNVVNSFTAAQLEGIGILEGTFAGTASTAEKAASLVELSDDPAVSEDADLTPVADSLLAMLGAPADVSAPPPDEDVLIGEPQDDFVF